MSIMEQLDAYREEMKQGTLRPPVPVPGTELPPEPVLASDPLAFGSPGDYEKQVSGLTFDELDCAGKL